MRLVSVAGSLVLLLALTLGVAAAARQDSHAGAAPRPALLLAGTVGGLYPGAHKQLRVSIRNRRPYPVRVLSVAAAVAGRGVTCRGVNLVIRPLHVNLLVPARTMRAVFLPVSMRRSAPNGCKGATFGLKFTAEGRRG